MDGTKKVSMQLLSIIAAIGGLVMVGAYFNANFLGFLGGSQQLVQALLGVLILAYGLIGFQWYSKK